jgi:hypothetical protein
LGQTTLIIRLRRNTLQLAAGMNGAATRRSSKSEGGLASANSAWIPRSLLRGASFEKLEKELEKSPFYGHNCAILGAKQQSESFPARCGDKSAQWII